MEKLPLYNNEKKRPEKTSNIKKKKFKNRK